MKKTKNPIINNLDLIPAFFLPVVILLITFAILKVYPFGDRSIVNLDLYHQYLPIMSELQRKLHGGESIFYSFNGGLGTNFYSLSTYQNASPITWIFLALFSEASITLCAVCMILFKIGMISAVMYYYLKAVSKKESPDAKDRFLKLTLATMFALSGYILGYYTNVMWLDSIILTPLCVLGLRKAADGKGNLLFVISVFLLLFTNYYIGAMVFIFLILYYITYRVGEGKRLLSKTTLRMLILSGIAIVMSMVVLLPTAIALQKTADYGSVGEGFLRLLYNSIPTHLTQLLPGSNITVIDGPPNLYPGLISLIIFVFFCMQTGYDRRKKIAKIVLVAFVFVSTNLIPLDLIWNFGHEPNSFTGRYSFLLAFLLIEIVAEMTDRSLRIKAGNAIVAAACIGGLIAVSMAGDSFESLDRGFMIIISLILLGVYLFVMLALSSEGGSVRKVLLSLVILFEVVIVTYRGIGAGNIVTHNNFDIHRNEVAELMNIARANDPDCRMEIIGSDNDMPPYVYGYKGTSIFASSVPQSTYDTLKRYVKGGASGLNSFKYVSANAKSDSLLNIRYYISLDKRLDDPDLTEIASSGNCYLYENTYSTAAGFMLPVGAEKVTEPENEDFLKINEMKGNKLSGSTDVTRKGNMYISIPYDEGWHVSVDGKEMTDFEKIKGFVSFELDEGHHEIDMEYIPPGFVAGAVISLAGAGLLILFLLLFKKYQFS